MTVDVSADSRLGMRSHRRSVMARRLARSAVTPTRAAPASVIAPGSARWSNDKQNSVSVTE